MKALLVLPLLFCSLFCWSQAPVEPDERLLAVYEKAYLDRLKTENPFLIQRLNFYLDHGYYLADYPDAKGALPVVSIDNPESINILLLEKEQGLRKNYETDTAYSINGTQKALVLRSGREFNRLLNEKLGRSH